MTYRYTIIEDQIKEIETQLVGIQSVILQIKGSLRKDENPVCTCDMHPEPHYHCGGCNAVLNDQYDPEGLCCSCYVSEQDRLRKLDTIPNKIFT